MIPAQIDKYLRTRAVAGPWRMDGLDGEGFDGAVVIPSLAERKTLPATLRSLAENPPRLLERFPVVVVVNHRSDAGPADREENLATLRALAHGRLTPKPLRLGWIDAASPGMELPAKGGGVGLARKIGLDLALEMLDFGRGEPLLVSLDADTLVRPDYLPALTGHFRAAVAGGAVIPFLHQRGATADQQAAIVRYELFLRSYVLGLSLAGSPYAFHTVGSAMACTASAYVRAGGMNGRAAGEDFYFLQQLHRTSGVARVEGTVVYPSARASHRVPFGTGRSVGRLLEGDGEAVRFYRPECFSILGRWLAHLSEGMGKDGGEIMAGTAAISPHLREYLEGHRFARVWDGLRRNHRDPARLLAAFHGWFDGLKTMRLVHHLSDGPFPRCRPEEAVPSLLAMAGREPVEGMEEQLALMRRMEMGDELPEGKGENGVCLQPPDPG